MQCHMIFTVKIDGFVCKARLFTGGHMTDTPALMTYASIVSQETVHIALTVAALNDLEVKTSDIQNAYLTVLKQRYRSLPAPGDITWISPRMGKEILKVSCRLALTGYNW